MPRAVVRTFRSGNSEALRLPKDLAYGDGVELTLVRSGDVLTIYPTKVTGRMLVDRLAAYPLPSVIGTRDEVEIPDREGL